ncbi:MAG TPA: hypothetical protein VLL31_02620 [Sulfurovum sp.]|nr:hypothetical protein [Sulfurovum sp.]
MSSNEGFVPNVITKASSLPIRGQEDVPDPDCSLLNAWSAAIPIVLLWKTVIVAAPVAATETPKLDT